MSKNPLVIELGERSVQVCHPARVREGGRLNLNPGHSCMFPMPADVMDNGFVTNVLELGRYIRENLNKQRIREKNVTFVVSSGKIIVREVTLPPVQGDKKIRAMVDANAGEYFPIDLASFKLAYTVLGMTSESEGDRKLRVTVYAIPAELLDGYAELAKVAGLKLHSIDYSGNSQYHLFKEINAAPVTMYAYIDHLSSRMTFMRGSELLLQRALSFGGGTLPEEYLVQTGREGNAAYFDAVRELSREDYIEAPMPEEKANVVFARLAIGIERSLRYFNSKYGDSAVESVVLTGPLAKLYRLREIVENELALGVVVMTEQVNGSLPYMNCIGAAVAPIGIPQKAVNAKSKAKDDKKPKRKATMSGGLLIMILAAFAAAAISLSAWLDLRYAQDEKAELEAKIASMLYAEAIYEDYLVYRNGAAESLNLLNSLNSPNDDLRAFFEELEEKMPSEITMLSISCTKQGISMNVTVPTKTDVARVMVRFREFESLGRLSVPSISETLGEAGDGSVVFSVYYEYKGVVHAEVPDASGGYDIEKDLEDYFANGGAAK